MTASKCPKTDLVARAFPKAVDHALQEHMQGCAACQREWAALAQLRQLALHIPAEQPDAERRDAVRARLLYQAERLRQQTSSPHSAPVAGAASAWRRGLRGASVAVAALVVLLVGGFVLRGAVHPRTALSNPAASDAWLAPIATDRQANHPDAHSIVRADVVAHGDARFSRQRSLREEVIDLHHGSVQIAVQPLPPGTRFWVRVGSAQVEVRGTLFTVTADHDRLTAVSVTHGLVDVRRPDAALLQLAAGQAWHAEPSAQPVLDRLAAHAHATTSPTATVVAPDRSQTPAAQRAYKQGAAPARPAVAPTAAVTGSPSIGGLPRSTTHAAGTLRPDAAVLQNAASPTERAFSSGFAALKQGAFANAAADFDRAVALSPHGALSEDARFWSGVAWARAGRSREAMASLRAFLAQHPRSSRQPEAAVALGWLLIRDRKIDEAERILRSTASPRSPEVADSLRAALAAISTARSQP